MTLRARFPATTVQAMEELIDSQALCSRNLGATFPDGAALSRRGGVDREASDPRGELRVEAEAERLSDKLSLRAVLGIADSIELLGHSGQ